MSGGKPSPVESEELIATIPRGERAEVRVRRVRLLNGVELMDIRLWRTTWRGQLPCKGVALHLSEAPEIAAALLKGSEK